MLFGIGPLDRRAGLVFARFPGVISGGHEGENNHGGNDVMDALVDVRHRPPERIAEQDHAPHPAESSADIIEKVPPVAHLCSAGYRRAKRPDDRNKSREDDRLSAISLIKFVGALKVPSLEKSG